MKKLKILLFLCIVACTLTVQAQKQFTLNSPDGKLQTTITVGDKLTYDIHCNGRQILAPSPISMTLDNGEVWGEKAKLSGTSGKKVDQMIPSPFYRLFGLKKTGMSSFVHTMMVLFTALSAVRRNLSTW